MTREQAQQITKTLADATRFGIFERIAAKPDELACSDLRCNLAITPATLSHHVKELTDAGLITVRRETKFMHLKLNKKVWKDYLSYLSKIK